MNKSSDLQLSKIQKEKLTMMDKDGKALYFLCDCGSVVLNDNNSIRIHEKTNKHSIYENLLRINRYEILKEYKKSNPNATQSELLDQIY